MYYVEETLPEIGGRVDRQISYGYTFHGDIRLSYVERDKESSQEVVSQTLRFAHSSDVVLLGALVGFYVRIGKEQDEINTIFTQAGISVLNDKDYQDETHDLSPSLYYLSSLAKGVPMKRYDKEELGWRALHSPIPCQPGVVEGVGGVGVYTTQIDSTCQSLVLEPIPPEYAKGASKEYKPAVLLHEVDVPVLARVICDLSMGEYRSRIHQFLTTEVLANRN